MGHDWVYSSNSGLTTHQSFTDRERFLGAAGQRLATVRDPRAQTFGGSGSVRVERRASCIEAEFEEADLGHHQGLRVEATRDQDEPEDGSGEQAVAPTEGRDR